MKQKRKAWNRRLCGFAVWCALGSRAAVGADLAAADLANFTIEELSNIEVTSVSRRPEALSRAAASIFVITAEDIRRSGATSLPEALRLAPNLQVARINNRLHAITARGFNTNIANKLLVLIDGRTVNLLGHWKLEHGADAGLDVTAYYDRTRRTDRRLLQETAEIFDLDVKHAIAFDAHRIVWGGGYRPERSEFERSAFLSILWRR